MGLFPDVVIGAIRKTIGRQARAAGVVVVMALGACRGGAVADGPLAGGAAGAGAPPNAAGGPASTGDGGDGGAVAGGSSVSSPGAASGGPDRGSPAAGPDARCGALTFTAPLMVAPGAAGQAYTRCGTLGPEGGWRVTLSPAGNRLAALTGAGTVRLVATDRWAEVAQLASPLGRMDAVAFSPDGTVVATLSSEAASVALWRANDGSLVRVLPSPRTASGVETLGGALAFSSDGRRLATSLATVIDLQTGISTSWLDGTTSTFAPQLNPERVGLPDNSGWVPLIRFSAADARLFIQTRYRVGNSPETTRLELRDPRSGARVALMFEVYTRALLGFAISPDGKWVALGKTDEAGVGGFTAGLSLVDATTGAEVAADPTFTGTVLGFSPDGARLYTRTGGTITAVATRDLHQLGAAAWPAAAAFLAMSPTGEIVGSIDGQTSWWDPATGAIVRTASYPLTAVAWSSDGRFGAGSGDAGGLFHLWREADGAELCAPPADPTSAPSLASLGTAGPVGENDKVTSVDGSVTATASFVVHDHAVNYDAVAVTDTATGNLLRQFWATIGVQQLAMSVPAADRLYTREGADVAVWCR